MPGQPVTALLFGKLPAHGDFIARGCSPEERACLDGWLTASLADAQGRFRADFAERFDTALPWRGEGVGSIGVIAASQDAAGRRYPLVLLCAAAGEIEDLVYAAIAERWDADRLVAAAGVGPATPIDRWSAPDANRALNGAQPPTIVTAMLESAGV
ncbi:type VI secretion system-associated protein TagF [Sphingomonadaceae bacterium OTU29LAMAA1]|nr:type VI secretion system-associated protein TagF [Sphingomonadaceae bacterium OTU29LAMAA1]